MSETQTQQPTSAAEYRKLRAEAHKKTPNARPVPLPSGAVFMLCIPDIQSWIMTGRLPQSFVKEYLTSADRRGVKLGEAEKAPEDFMADMSGDGAMDALNFMREVVTAACVNPRIVIGATGDDEIAPEEIDPVDFRFILDWVLEHSGVAGVSGLRNFRPGRERGTPGAGADGPELQPAAVAVSEGRGSGDGA